MGTTWVSLKEGLNSFKLEDLAGIEVERNHRVKITYIDPWYGRDRKQTVTLDCETAVRIWQEDNAKRNFQIVGKKDDTSYELFFRLKDGSKTDGVWIAPGYMDRFFKGEIMGGYNEYTHFTGYSVNMVKLGTTTYRRMEVFLPKELLLAAIHKASRNPAFGRTRSFFRFTRRHEKFWSPRGLLKFHDRAAKMYVDRFRWKAYEDRTLKDIIQQKVQTACNYSRNQNDPVTVNISRDGDDSFYFWFTDKNGQRRAFNGGIVWHGDHYSVHT